MELWVSLVRNAACVLKSLLPPEYTVMQPLMAFPVLGGAGWAGKEGMQLERFTGLEGFIGVLQVVGACFNLVKGAQGLSGGVLMTPYFDRWRNALASLEPNAGSNAREVDLLKEILRRQDTANSRRIASGICQLVIGAGLLCLACFSWKLVGTTAVATAVAILEFALAVLLTIGMASVWRVWTISTKVQLLEKPTAHDVDVVELLAPLSTSDSAWEPDVRLQPTAATLRIPRVVRYLVSQLKPGALIPRFRTHSVCVACLNDDQAALDAFLVALNVAAFFGYGTIPLDVFFPDRSLLTLWLPPGDTSWWGNFIGDVAWTIEPITVVLAPYLLLRQAQAQARVVGKQKTQ
ncbi:unnamed protein product [Ascophyllum nodosum]